MSFRRPCLDCAKLTRDGSRCEDCQRVRDQAREQRRGPREHYHGDWPRIAHTAIERQPFCSNCGATKDLTGDHVDPRTLRRGVDVLCRSCNARKGAA